MQCNQFENGQLDAIGYHEHHIQKSLLYTRDVQDRQLVKIQKPWLGQNMITNARAPTKGTITSKLVKRIILDRVAAQLEYV